MCGWVGRWRWGQIEYSFTAADEEEPFARHRAVVRIDGGIGGAGLLEQGGQGGGQKAVVVVVQFEAAVRGRVTARVAQAVNGLAAAAGRLS